MSAGRWSQPEFGRRVKELRVERGLAQSALAGDGMSTGYLSRLERGERQATAKAARYLAEQLGVPLATFDEASGRQPEQPGSRDTGRLSRLLASAASAGPGLSGLEKPLAEALAAQGESSPELRWQALWLLAEHAGRNGEHQVELGRLQELAAVGEVIGSAELRARAQHSLARCHRSLGDFNQAVRHASTALAIAQEHRLPAHETLPILLVLISAEVETGRLPDASAYTEELLPLVTEVCDNLAAQALWTAATVHNRKGDQAAAQQLIEQALARADSREDLLLWLRLRLAAASLYLQAEPPRTEAAAPLLQQAEVSLALIGTELQRQELLTLQAHLAFHTGRFADARALCERLAAQELRISFRDRSRLEILSCRLLILDGRLDEGVRRLRALAEQARDALSIDLVADIWRLVAQALSGELD